MTERLNGTQTTSTTTSSATRLAGMTPKTLAGEDVGQRLVDAAAGKRPERQRDAEIDRAGGDGRDDRLQAADR